MTFNPFLSINGRIWPDLFHICITKNFLRWPMSDFCTAILVHISWEFNPFFIKACKSWDIGQLQVVSHFKVTWGLKRVMYRSSCGLIRVGLYWDTKLFLCFFIFPSPPPPPRALGSDSALQDYKLSSRASEKACTSAQGIRGSRFEWPVIDNDRCSKVMGKKGLKDRHDRTTKCQHWQFAPYNYKIPYCRTFPSFPLFPC